MHRYIDQLLMDGKEDEAIPLIEEVWRKEREQTEKEIANLTRKIEALKKERK